MPKAASVLDLVVGKGFVAGYPKSTGKGKALSREGFCMFLYSKWTVLVEVWKLIELTPVQSTLNLNTHDILDVLRPATRICLTVTDCSREFSTQRAHSWHSWLQDVKCRGCDVVIKSDSNFCRHCGNPMKAEFHIVGWELVAPINMRIGNGARCLVAFWNKGIIKTVSLLFGAAWFYCWTSQHLVDPCFCAAHIDGPKMTHGPSLFFWSIQLQMYKHSTTAELQQCSNCTVPTIVF